MWLIKKTLHDYKDSSLDLLKVNLICIKRNSMMHCMKKVKREYPNPFISSFIGMETILETKLREFVILSKDKDLNFQPCRRYKIKWIKLKKELAVLKMFGWKQRSNSEINLNNSIKLTKTLWREIRIMVPSNQPCTCIKCSWLRKKLFTEH